jgi:hypothetical protein
MGKCCEKFCLRPEISEKCRNKGLDTMGKQMYTEKKESEEYKYPHISQ